VAALDPKPAFDIAQVRRYDPTASRGVQAFAAAQFIALLAGTTVFLWYSDVLPFAPALVWLAALTAGLWATGAALQGRLTVMEVLFVDAAALATASGALGIVGLHVIFKPLALMILIAFACTRLRASLVPGRFSLLLIAGLVASLTGDVLLMWPQFFVPGLICFLLAHLAYIALFSIDVGTFPRRRAIGATLSIGVLMYAFLWWGGLPAGLRVPVGIYVIVIACMAAQALGRAATMGDTPARHVALGACLFMLSDALLATNRFVQPLPVASLWVLASYYAAQWLIAANVRPTGSIATR
jgi:uncharacterized membrane protein YhhN